MSACRASRSHCWWERASNSNSLQRATSVANKCCTRSAVSTAPDLCQCCTRSDAELPKSLASSELCTTNPQHFCVCAQSHSCADPQPASKTAAPADGSIIKDSDSITEGPMRVYLDGRNSGLYRPDPRQETTIQLLQALYDKLKQVHVDHKRPSGLTTTDHIGTGKPRHSW